MTVYGAEMTDAEVACCLSHRTAYARIVALRLPMALVLEDDVDCDDDLAHILRLLAAAPPAPWLVLRLQSTKGEVVAGAGKGRGVVAARLADRTISRLSTGVLGGCGYVVKLEGARRLLRYTARTFMPADQCMDRFWENGVAPYVLRPFPVRQCEAIPSEIGARKIERSADWRWTAARRLQRAWDGLAKRAYALRPAVAGPRSGPRAGEIALAPSAAPEPVR